jgi:hypothetical protein
VTASSEDRWTDLCRRVGSEKDPQKRLAILVEIEAAAREEQEELKLRLRPQIQRYKLLTKNASAAE